MTKFKVGDRVSVYDHHGFKKGRIVKEISRRVVKEISNRAAEYFLIVAHPKGADEIYHEKQCRRLVKKPKFKINDCVIYNESQYFVVDINNEEKKLMLGIGMVVGSTYYYTATGITPFWVGFDECKKYSGASEPKKKGWKVTMDPNQVAIHPSILGLEERIEDLEKQLERQRLLLNKILENSDDAYLFLEGK